MKNIKKCGGVLVIDMLMHTSRTCERCKRYEKGHPGLVDKLFFNVQKQVYSCEYFMQ